LIRSHRRGGGPAFAILNLTACYLLFFREKEGVRLLVFACGLYLALICGQYLLLRFWGHRHGWRAWAAFFAPIALLIAVRYVPLSLVAGLRPAWSSIVRANPHFGSASYFFVGISYMAFRTSYLVLEVRNRTVHLPSLAEYVGFAFFMPTLPVGPISRYSTYLRGFAESGRPAISVVQALLRILVGGVKLRFLAPLADQLSYKGLLLDGHPHVWFDFPIAAVAYYLFLYCNFSGFCDIAIGMAGMMGIPVDENFDSPFAADSVRDFWNRWHITLSQYMRDVLFTPLSKALVGLFGPARASHAIAVAIVVVFLTIGVWHGVGWNYAAFGAVHALGVVTNHYYTIFIKKRLGPKRFAAYNKNRLVEAIAVALTFCFVAASMFFFANDWGTMGAIVHALKWH
jgi:D-alanyl-lipoteichoic acid acyltransferase DltB (MBOAT superfamily)